MWYINDIIGLGMLNRSKLHLNWTGAIQLVKNYREILKPWQQKEKSTNESVTILNDLGS